MSDSFIIEAGDRAAGIIVRDRHSFRFYAAGQPFFALEGRTFGNPLEATRAAERLIAGPSRVPSRRRR